MNIVSCIEDIFAEIPIEKNIRNKSRLITELQSLLEELRISCYSINNLKNKKELLEYYAIYNSKLNNLLLLDNTNKINNNVSLLLNTENKSLEELKRANEQLLETIDIAINVNTNLELQGEKIKKIQTKTKQIDTELDHSNSVLKKMLRWWRS